MKIVSAVLVAVLVAALASCGGGPSADELKRFDAEATETSTAWVKLVDAGDYAKSHSTAAGFFRTAVKRDDWVEMMRARRRPLGAAVKRTFIEYAHETSLPGCPDGEYIILNYTTTFDKKKNAAEMVTVMRDTDSAWRVAGYFIK
jgi:hypothetical protein